MKTIGRLLITIFMFGTLATSCTDYQDEIDALDKRVAYLESLVDQVNAKIYELQGLADALKDADCITDVTETPDGYIISFKKNDPILIHNGIDGLDGKDAEVPEIAIKKGEDGDYYWVVDGEWLQTPDGQKVRSNGKDGKDDVDGKAIAPQVRINDATNVWEISTDEGKTWTPTGTTASGKDGKDGKDANAIVNVVTHWNEGYVEFITAAGTFRIPLDDTQN